MNDRVEILMATYNSADYLAPMLASLVAQDHDDFHLVISDDGSTDDTLDIVNAHAPQFRHPVTVLRQSPPTGSAMANFGLLMAQSRGSHVFLADHDDIWLPGKVANGLRDLKAAEATAGADTPILYHSDLEVIDAAGRVTHPSFWTFKRSDPTAAQNFGAALIQPAVTGCAMAMNAALIRRALPIPDRALMHDWWLTLVASAFGRVIHDATPQIQYRIHGRNLSRPRQVGVLQALRQIERIPQLRRGMRRRLDQGRAFHDRFADDLPAPIARQAAQFAALGQSWPGLRQLRMIRGGFLGPDPFRNAVQLLLM